MEIQVIEVERVIEINIGVDEKEHWVVVITEDYLLVFLNTTD